MKPLLKHIYYADPGDGKTHLFGTITDVPEMMPALLIDFEGNTDCIESKCNYLGTNEEGFKNLTSNPISLDKINVISCRCRYKTLLKADNEIDFAGIEVFEKVLNWLYTENNLFVINEGTLGIDSLSAVDYWVGQWILKKFPLKNGRFNPEVMEIPDFRKMLEMHLKFISVITDLPIHLIVTAQTYYQTNQQTHVIEGIYPRLTGQAREAVPGALKAQGYLRRSNGERVMHFEDFGKAKGKDNSEGNILHKAAPSGLKNPTMRKIYDLRYGGNK